MIAELDCGSVCTITPNCTFFAFDTKYKMCNLFPVLKSPSLVMLYASNYTSSCGYLITGSTSPAPIWTNKSPNDQVMSASNCSFIGTDPI